MGGGAMLPQVIGAVGVSPCPSTVTRPTHIAAATSSSGGNDLHSHHLFSVISGVPTKPSSSTDSAGLAEACRNDEKLDDLIGRKDVRKSNFDYTLGPVPSRTEVQKALADLHRFMHGQTDSDFGSLLSPVSPKESRMLQCPGYARLHDAMSMLEKEPSIQNMVVSMSSDKAVWEAILNNRAVQDLRGSLSAGNEEKRQNFNEVADIVSLVLNWIMGFTKSKVVELIEKFGLLVTEIFQSADKEKPTSELCDLVEEKIRSSLLLSVVILLIVVVTRNHGA